MDYQMVQKIEQFVKKLFAEELSKDLYFGNYICYNGNPPNKNVGQY